MATNVSAKSEILPEMDLNLPLLRVEDLQVEFHTRDGIAKAVNGASFSVDRGETLAIVGESGSGKSVTSQAIMGILESPPAKITGGRVLFHGVDLLTLSKERRRRSRANYVAMVFQDALSALNPVWTVGFQIAELFRQHRGMSKKDAMKRSLELLDLVKIPAAAQRINEYPHQFSGGMRQRVMIAMALALDPHLLIADEPTTALDVTVQAQIMRLLKEIQVERQMGLILITHDLGVVADVADKISVMYAGRIVEQAPVMDTFATPAHPYTKALLRSIPRLDTKGQRLEIIKGLPPVLTDLPAGCNFAPRCVYAQEICTQQLPPLATVAADRAAACHFSSEVIRDV